MSKADEIVLKGRVISMDRGSKFKVIPDDNKDMVIDCTLSGKIRQNYIRILVGDSVDVSMSTYDPTKGRITWRYK